MRLIYQLLCMLLVCFLSSTDTTAAVNVKITGVEDAQLKNVRAYLSIYSVAMLSPKESEGLSDFAISRLHDKAGDEIRAALMPFGFYKPEVTGSLVKKNDDWDARYNIDAGLPTVIQSVDISTDDTANKITEVRDILARTQVRAGERLEHQQYTQLKQDLLRTLVSNGYLDARYTQSKLLVEPDKQRASVHMVLDSGSQFVFGPILLEQDALDQSFAQRYVTLREGEPFSSDRLVAMQFAFSDSGYYQSVSVTAPKDEAVSFAIPVVIKATPRKSQRYVARVGLGTDTGPRVQLGTEFRRLSGRGNKFRSDIQLSSIRSIATAQYSIPIKNVATDRQTFSGSFDRAEIGDSDSDIYALGARRYDRWKGLGRQLYIEFENEQFTLGEQTDVRTELLIFGASLAYQAVDDAIFTRKGLTARLDVHGASDGALSDVSFLQTTLATRAIYPLSSKSRLLLRAEVGVTEVNDLSELPPSQRFFTGGDRTIRGYGFQELSPKNADGLNIGGRYVIAASVEADYFFNDKYGVAAFFDHGNSVNSLSDALKSGVGLGFRYRTPIGVLRIDAARPLDQTEDTFRLHVSLGPDS